jgi:ribonucleoside-diphosphate reductase beta chain
MATTAPRPATRRAVDDISYTDLYERWERGNWRATEIDFTQDKIDWHERMTEEQRRSTLWLFSLFFHGEDAVTDGLSPYIDAAPLEEQKYFITTQQVDEARHSVAFNRFMNEVVGLGDGTIAGGMAATEDQLTWGHSKIFGELEEQAERLRGDQSPAQLASAITLYHVVIEGTLAQPGQHVIESFLKDTGLLPGFLEAIVNVAADEQRHIAFGVKLLADLYDANPVETEEAITGTLRKALPWAIALPKPPDWDEEYFRALGTSFDELMLDSMRLLEMRLRTIGLKLESIKRFPLPMDLPFEERTARGRTLLEANLIGPDRPAISSPEANRVMFDTMARAADVGAVRPGTVIEWAFTDDQPWQLKFSGNGCEATTDCSSKADLKLVVSYNDWADVFALRADPRKLLLARRLRPKGDPRLLLKFGKIFP